MFKIRLVNVIKYVGFLLLGIGLTWFTFRETDINQMLNRFMHIDVVWLIPAFLATLLAHYLRALRWNMLIETLGFRVNGATSFFAVCIAYFANMFVPRLGEVTRCTVINRKFDVPMDKLIGTVILERLTDVATVLLLLVALLAVYFKLIGGFFAEILGEKITFIEENYLWISIVAVLSVAFTLIIIRFWYNELKKLPLLGKIFHFIEGMLNGLTSVLKLKKPLLFVFYSFAIWFCYLLTTLSAFNCLEASSNLSWMEGLVVMVAGGFGMAAPSPNGIGSYHLFVSKSLMLFGLSQTEGLDAATINHLSQTLLVLVLGIISLVLVWMPFSYKTN